MPEPPKAELKSKLLKLHEIHTKKLNYIISAQQEARIREYISGWHPSLYINKVERR